MSTHRHTKISSTQHQQLNWGKMNAYWKKVRDPHYYDPVTSPIQCPLSGTSPVDKAQTEYEFTTTSRILTPRNAAKDTE